MFYLIIIRHKIKRIQSKKHQLGTYEIDKISLSCFDDKRYVLDDGIYTLSYFTKIVSQFVISKSIVIIEKIVIIKKDCHNWKRSRLLKKIVIIEKGCHNWIRLWLLKKIVTTKKNYACDKINSVVI